MLSKSDCLVVMMSPVEYEECVVDIEVEATGRALIRITDEKCDGRMIVEFIDHDTERVAERMLLSDFRALLLEAENKLSL